ncbi:MAG: hypothetical protein MRERV_32c042 [Mycoplasmataceae bacterium RV_VA103A]|nr:MAG: hypothetical protein MRERV_32c042 [Mycoplasmataceae bacterium RV_VA103A]
MFIRKCPCLFFINKEGKNEANLLVDFVIEV